MVNKKVSVGKIEINFTNRSLYTLIAFFMIVIMGAGVYAFGTIPNPGHAVSQIQTCDSAGQILKMSGGAWTCAADEVGAVGGGTVGGSGVANYIPKWTTSSALGSSVLYENSGSIGVGTTDPGAKFGVSGSSLFKDLFNSDIKVAINGGAQGQGGLIFYKDNSNRADIMFTDSKLYLAVGIGVTAPLNTKGLVIDTAGNVGIGTISPTNKLHIIGNASVSTNFSVDTTTFHVDSNNNRVGIGTTAPVADLNVLGSGWFSGNLGTGGNLIVTKNMSIDTTTFHVDSNNNRVGIGTPAPQDALHVKGGGIILEDFYSSLELLDDFGNKWWMKGLGGLYFGGGTDGGIKMFIAPDGDIGIGTTEPLDKLHVKGGGIILEDFYSSLELLDDFGNKWWMKGLGGLYFGGGTDGQIKMLIAPDGKVGIGTTDPQAALDVNGAIKVGTSAGAPFDCDATKQGSIYLDSAVEQDETNFMGCRLIYAPENYGWVKLNS